jgi:transposase
MRIAPQVVLTSEQRAKLETYARGRSTQARVVLRARIVLLAGEGKQDLKIAHLLSIVPRTAARWRSRFLHDGIAGLEHDAPRPGRTPSISPQLVRMVIAKTTQQRPSHATHWSTRTMAAVAGVSEASVRRMWHSHGLKPHRVETFKLSNDPRFAEKLEDIVGLYLNPPEHELHPIVDNYATHKHPAVLRCAARHKRFHFHFTPTSSSWLNMVERFFRDLTENQLRRGVFTSVEALQERILAYIQEHNRQPKPLSGPQRPMTFSKKLNAPRLTSITAYPCDAVH